MATATASGCPFSRARSAAFVGQAGAHHVAQVVQLAVPAADHLRTSPIRADFLKTMSRQASGKSAATPSARSSM